ncbi:hypothetical protein [Liquorilactobacillus nagelii]|jgi:hypothetical protein|nr:hypothetical protein [Liquorilactobacillus nagelii]
MEKLDKAISDFIVDVLSEKETKTSPEMVAAIAELVESVNKYG